MVYQSFRYLHISGSRHWKRTKLKYPRENELTKIINTTSLNSNITSNITTNKLLSLFSRTHCLIKSHLIKQNNNNETSPQASPRSTPKLSLDSTTTALEVTKNGKVEDPNPVKLQPPGHPSPRLAQVLTQKPLQVSLHTYGCVKIHTDNCYYWSDGSFVWISANQHYTHPSTFHFDG